MESQTHAKVLLKGRTNYEADDKQRRSANYKPNIWKYDFLQSLSTKYDEDQHKRRCETLKEDVKKIFVEAKDFLAKLELVDSITKLGLASHFEEEIKVTLETISSSMKNKSLPVEEDLYATALSFRLRRQYGYEVTQDIFRGFLDEMGTFMAGKCLDIRGVLELFEASHLGFEGEIVLDGAKAFSTGVLMSKYTTTADSNLCKRVLRALDLPHHWRVQWFDVKWHINFSD